MTDGLLIAALAVGLGTAACFAGQRLFAVLLAIAGFAAGFVIASTVAPLLIGRDIEPLVALGVGAIGGLIGAFLVRTFFRVAILLAFGAFGGSLAAALVTAMGAPHLTVPAVVVGGIIASLAAAILDAPRWLVIGVTSLVGAATIVVGGSIILGRLDAEPISAAVASATAALDPAQPLPVLIMSILGGQWLAALTRPVELVMAQPLLVTAIAIVAAVGALAQASGRLLPRPLVARRA